MINKETGEITFDAAGNDVTVPIDKACELAHRILIEAAQFRTENQPKNPEPWKPDELEDWKNASKEDRLLIEAKHGRPIYP